MGWQHVQAASSLPENLLIRTPPDFGPHYVMKHDMHTQISSVEQLSKYVN
jgi:hypothetical protein